MDSIKSGPLALDENYWQVNYDEPETMDGVANAREHSQYAYYFFKIDQCHDEIKTLLDVGCGPGHMLVNFAEQFSCKAATGIDLLVDEVLKAKGSLWQRMLDRPHRYAFTTVPIDKKKSLENYLFHDLQKEIQYSLVRGHFKKHVQDLREKKKNPFWDLILCTSVFQYVEEASCEGLIKNLAQHCRFLYFTVPTTLEYRHLESVYQFVDPYAYRRSKIFYLRRLKKYFRLIGTRIWESKHFVSESETPFKEYLYR